MQKDKNLIFILAVLAMIIGFFAHTQGRPLFGDECTELLQALDRPKGFFILTPSFSANWVVSTIESLVTYIYSFFLENFGFKNGLVAIRAVHVGFFTLSAVLLYLVLRRLVSSFWAFSGSVVFVFSNYALCFMQILTRNAITPFWILCSLLFLGMVFNRQNVNQYKRYHVLFLILAIITATLGLVTYSGFRIYVTALSLALFINCILYQRNKIKMALLYPIAIVGVLYVLLIISNTTTEAFLYRGSYALVKKEYFLQVFLQVLFFPFKFYQFGHFVIEQAHVLVGRSPFPFYLVPFFCIGFFMSFSNSFYKGKRENFYTLVFLRNFIIISVLLFSFLGPNLKYFYGLWPILIVFCVLGMERVMVRINPSKQKLKMMIGALLLIFAFDQVCFFSFQMKNSSSAHAFLYQDAKAKQLIDEIRPMIEFDERPSWVYSPLGRDVALWYAKSTELPVNVLDRWAIFLQDKGFVNLEKDTSLNLEGFLFTKNNLNEDQKNGLEKVLKNNPKLKWIEISL